MANCTRTRTRFSTPLSDAAWNFQRSLVADQDAARAEAERLAGIASHFTFAKDDAQTFMTAAGQPVQLAMSLIGMDGKVRTVIVKQVDGEWVWEAENLHGCPFAGWELIAVVKQRIGARLANQLTGKVTLPN